MREFLDANPELEYVRVDSDGNCFFRSLAAYYARTGEQIPGIADPTDFHELRTYIVRQFGELIPRDAELRAVLPAMNERPIKTILSELSKTCVWNVPVFEMMVERVSDILHVNLMIYRVNTNEGKYSVTWRLYTPRRGPAATNISVFLASNHYGLIFPRARSRTAALAASYARQANNNANLNAAIAASMNQLKLNNTRRKKASHNNANLNAAIAASMNQLRLNANNENMRRAMAASMLVSNFDASFEPGAAASTRKKKSAHGSPKAASAAASANASGVSVENIQQQIPYKTTTVVKIKKMLDDMGIAYSSKDRKEELYGLLVTALLGQ